MTLHAVNMSFKGFAALNSTIHTVEITGKATHILELVQARGVETIRMINEPHLAYMLNMMKGRGYFDLIEATEDLIQAGYARFIR